jgi:hypothetical protein
MQLTAFLFICYKESKLVESFRKTKLLFQIENEKEIK